MRLLTGTGGVGMEGTRLAAPGRYTVLPEVPAFEGRVGGFPWRLLIHLVMRSRRIILGKTGVNEIKPTRSLDMASKLAYLTP